MSSKAFIKSLLGDLPFVVEADWQLRYRDKQLKSRFRLPVLEEHLPEIVSQVVPHVRDGQAGKKVFFFASWHYWIVHTTLCGLTLKGLGYDVTLGYLPYGNYQMPVNKYDLRLQNLYARDVLQSAKSLITFVPFLDLKLASQIPPALAKAVEQVTIYDTQYALQREEVTGKEPIYLLRQERNSMAAAKAYAYFQKKRPDVVIVPNGMIQEYGAVYETARFLGIPAVTYEFGEQDQRIWIGQDRLVINHVTDELWAARRNRQLTGEQRTWLESFLASRQGLSTGGKFAHLWQKADRAGGKKVRAALGLDERPIVLLPTNVLGDSATLGRTLFSSSMADWIEKTVLFFATKFDVQLVIRIHPGETMTVGPSVEEIIRRVLPELPSHIRMIGPREKVNTYDLIDIADLALVFTTTAGLEMAVRGVPVMVSGNAHYREKGFTLDADTQEEYYALLEQVLLDFPAFQLTPEQVEQAWNYAYCFFREYPRPFPWHVEKIAESVEKRPLAYVLGLEGRLQYEETFRQLAGEPINW